MIPSNGIDREISAWNYKTPQDTLGGFLIGYLLYSMFSTLVQSRNSIFHYSEKVT